MTKLDEIRDELFDLLYDEDHLENTQKLDLLVRAVRQLGAERKAHQALFEAVDNNRKLIKLQAPEVHGAFVVLTNTHEPDSEVLALIDV